MRMYNILTEHLPGHVLVNGVEYQIYSDFRTGIHFEELMGKRVPDEQKIMNMLNLYYPHVPDDLEGAVNAILDFYNGTEKKKDNDKGKKTGKEKKAIYSFSQDAPYIFAAFLQQYGINLNRIASEDLHWWEFIALFEALDDNTLMRKIMYYRDVSTAGMPAKERKRILKLKELYKLEDDTPTDAKTALAKRNANMKAYIQRRMRETQISK